MHITELSAMETSILNQIQNTGAYIPKKLFHSAIKQSFTGNEMTYDEIKLANKKLYKLIGKNINLPQTKLLYFIANSLGYSCHHSMKNTLNLPLRKPMRLINKRVSLVELRIQQSIRSLQNSPQFLFWQAVNKDISERGKHASK